MSNPGTLVNPSLPPHSSRQPMHNPKFRVAGRAHTDSKIQWGGDGKKEKIPAKAGLTGSPKSLPLASDKVGRERVRTGRCERKHLGKEKRNNTWSKGKEVPERCEQDGDWKLSLSFGFQEEE